MRLRRMLLLSGSLGKGHDVVAEAYADALAGYGVQSQIVDSMALLGGGPAKVGDTVFRKLLGLPGAYDAFHFSQLRNGGRLGRLAEQAALAKMHGPMAATVASFAPDLIVSVFATGAGAVARLKSDGLTVPSVVVITDSFAHRMWVHDETDLFLVMSDLTAESVRRYRPEAPLVVVPAPVRPGFLTAPDRAAARRQLGVPDEVTCVLLMSGAWGLGPLDDVARALAEAGIWCLAVAGTNAALRHALERLARTYPQVVVFGYTDRVPELMAAANVVVTSSGDTCREARTVGRGIVLLDVVPGHGRENLLHELELGGSTACLATPTSITGAVRAFLDRPDRSVPQPDTGARQAATAFVDALRLIGMEI